MAAFFQGIRPERAVFAVAASLVVTGLFSLGFVGNALQPDGAPVAAKGVGAGAAARSTISSTAAPTQVRGRALVPATSTTAQPAVSSEPASLESTTSTTGVAAPPNTSPQQVDVQVPGTAVHVTLGSGPGTCNDLGITVLKPDQCQGARRRT